MPPGHGGRGQRLRVVVLHQLGEAQHGVQRRSQLVAHARQKARPGLVFTQCQLAFMPRGGGGARVGDVPIHADALGGAAGRVVDFRRTRRQPAHLPVGPDDAEFQVQRGAGVGGVLHGAFSARSVVGVHHSQALFHGHHLAPRWQAAQCPHLRVPGREAGLQVQLPGAQACASRRQRGLFHGAAQGQLGAALFGHVDHHAEQHGPLVARFAPRMGDDLTHLAVGPQDAKVHVGQRFAAAHPARETGLGRGAVDRVHPASKPLGRRRQFDVFIQAEQ